MKKILKNLSKRIVTILLIAVVFIPIMDVDADNEIVIDIATVTVTEPVAGEAPSYNVTVGDSSKYWIDDNYITWNKIYPTSGFVTTFEAGSKYDFRVLFRPKFGYTFSSDTIFLINGHKTGKWGDSNAMASYYFSTVDSNSNINVYFHMQDDESNTTSITIPKGSTVPKPVNPTRNGYTFVRWETAQGYIFDFNEPKFSNPTELYAEWIENANLQTYTITLNPNNETEETDNITNVVNKSIINLGTLESHGFTIPQEKEFYGWKIGNEIYLPGEDIEVTSNMTAVAQYVGMTSSQSTTHTVEFNLDGGTWTDSGTNQVSVNIGEKVTRPTDPTKTGNLFVDWYADSGLTTPFDFANTTINANTTVYAKWSEYAQFGIGITPNAGSWDWNISPGDTGPINSMVLLSTIENHQVTFTAVANSGYHFVGWYEGVMNNETHFVDSHTDTLLSADSTYTVTITEYKTYVMAVFEEDTLDTSRVQIINSIDYNGLGSYTITGGTFDGLTSFSTTKAEFFEKGTEITLKATADSTYTFKGWYNAEEYDITGDKNLGVMSWRLIGDVLTTNSTYTFNATNDYYNVMPLFESKAGHNNIWTTSGGQIAVLYENRAEEQTNLDGNHWKDAGIVVDYWKNDEITVKAKAFEGFHFVGWFQTDPQASVPENYVKEPVISTSENYTYKPGVTIVSGVNEPINYITAVFEADSNQKQVEYTLIDGNAEVKFTYDEGHEFELVFKDITKFTDEELSVFGMTREKFNELLETIKSNTKANGELVGVFKIEVNEGEYGFTKAVKVKYKLTEEMKKYKSFKFIYLDDENNFVAVDIVDFTIDGDYITGTLPHLSAYALVGSEDEPAENPNGTTYGNSENDNSGNPQTSDNIMTYVYILIVSVGCLVGGIVYLNRKKLFGNK